MSKMAFFYVMADVPENSMINQIEQLVAQAIANGLVDGGIPGNVLVSWWKTFEGQSVATFAPNAAQATPIGSAGTTTAPVVVLPVVSQVVPNFITSVVNDAQDSATNPILGTPPVSTL